MSTPFQDLSSWTRDLLKLTVELTNRFANQIASWLVLGNAGALAIGFSAVLHGTSCNQGLVARAIWWFAAGLMSAFLGAAVTYAAGIVGVRALAVLTTGAGQMASSDFFIRELEEQKIDVPDDAPLRQQLDAGAGLLLGVQRQLPFIYICAGLSTVFYLASAVSFSTGILGPVLSTDAVFRSCLATHPSDTTQQNIASALTAKSVHPLATHHPMP